MNKPIVKVANRPNGHTDYFLYCPACDIAHVPNDTWGFNGDVDNPTFTPSILVFRPNERCHSFLTDGVWNYLSDCAHDKAGQSVPAVPWPYTDDEYSVGEVTE